MDLLGSIMGTMEKPPAPSARQRKMEKVMKARRDKLEEEEQKKREVFKQKSEAVIAAFMDGHEMKHTFEPANKVYRSILHEIAEAAGLLSFSFGTEDVKPVIVFKKEHPPSEEELRAIKAGEKFNLSGSQAGESTSLVTMDTYTPPSQQPQAPPSSSRHYQEKYRHLLGGLDCAEKSAVKMEPNRAFGCVPSANKRDLRSIEETLDAMRTRKRPRLETDETDGGQSQGEGLDEADLLEPASATTCTTVGKVEPSNSCAS